MKIPSLSSRFKKMRGELHQFFMGKKGAGRNLNLWFL